MGIFVYQAEPYFSFRRNEECSRKSNWCKLGRNLFYRPEPCLKVAWSLNPFIFYDSSSVWFRRTIYNLFNSCQTIWLIKVKHKTFQWHKQIANVKLVILSSFCTRHKVRYKRYFAFVNFTIPRMTIHFLYNAKQFIFNIFISCKLRVLRKYLVEFQATVFHALTSRFSGRGRA